MHKYLLGALALTASVAALLYVGGNRQAVDRNRPMADDPQALATGAMAALDFVNPPTPAPDTLFIGEAGAPAKLSDYRGRVLLVNFWATWCGPCLREMPALDALESALGGPDFAVLPISVDLVDRETVAAFLATLKLGHLPLLTDQSGDLQRAFAANALPTSLLIDRDGRVIARLLGAAEWNSGEAQALISKLVAAPAPG